MVYEHQSTVSDEERRAFLKALGVGGAVAAGSATIDDVHGAITATGTDDLAPTGRAIEADLTGAVDSQLVDRQQTELAAATSALPSVLETGFPEAESEPRDDFARVAAAGRPIYDHLAEVGFFESTTEHLPAFDSGFITSSVKTAITSDALADSLGALGFSESELVDLLAMVVNHRQRIGERHWVQTDELPRQEMAIGEHVAPMTQNAAGGALLWLDDLDQHVWSQQVLLTEEILSDAVWEARAMAAGFHLMADGASAIADGSSDLSDTELTALLSSGFALQAIAQNLLPEDVYWITEEMRSPARTDLEPAEYPAEYPH